NFTFSIIMIEFRSLYRSLPRPLRQLVEPAKRIFSFWENSRCHLWVVEGCERHTGSRLTLGFAGNEAMKNYVSRALFSEGGAERGLGRQWVFQNSSKAARLGADVDVFACEIPRALEDTFQPECLALLPTWIRMDGDLQNGSRVCNSKKFVQTRALVEREGLVAEAGHDPILFEKFYQTIYLPYIALRHESAAIVDSLDVARRKFVSEGRELLRVFKAGRLLGGIVVSFDGDGARFWVLGVCSEEKLSLGAGVVSDVLYYFGILRGLDKGCSFLNFGYCRPFLADGLIRYKREWGGRLVNDRMAMSGALALSIVRHGPAVKSFLEQNPFVAIDGPRRVKVCGFVGDGPEASEAMRARHSRYCDPSQVGLQLYSLSPEIRPRSLSAVLVPAFTDDCSDRSESCKVQACGEGGPPRGRRRRQGRTSSGVI
ncbi:MAG: hypothetical protein WCL08_03730, partial [Verrucomicrobiota bacterium]